VITPATLNFTVNIAVPIGMPAGSSVFDIVALADGGDIGHQTLTVSVPASNKPPVCTNVKPNVTALWPPNHQFVPALYRVAFTADDGNGGTGTVKVTVPKSQGGDGAAVKSAPVVNSFGP
jgi:hypothetical protein